MAELVETGPVETRALWRRIVDFPLVAMVIAIALYILATKLAVVLGKLVPPIAKDETTAIHALVILVLVLATYKLAIIRLGEQPRDDLPGRGALRNLGLGLAAGLVIFSVVVGLAAVAGVYRIYGCCSTRELAMDLITIAIMPAFMEELLFRGILFRWLEEFGGSWAALIVTSALFGLAHIFNPNASWFSSFAIAVEAGVLLGAAYMLTRSLWMPMGLHAAWNFTQGFIFDVPVSGMNQQGLVEAKLSGPELLSGGTFGLEASVIALAIATLFGLWLLWLAIRKGELMQPWWVRPRALRAS
ncbi:MAG: CPBP family intramembrane glutamic endopeptidase [Sphingomicrobium sp.]